LDAGLTGSVFVFRALAVAPPEEGGFCGAFFTDDSSSEGIIAVFDVVIVDVYFDDAIV
jgi:hypothetical protein